MKYLAYILVLAGLIMVASALHGCAGIYLESGEGNLHDARQNAEGWYWYDGQDNLGDCVKDFNQYPGDYYLTDYWELW